MECRDDLRGVRNRSDPVDLEVEVVAAAAVRHHRLALALSTAHQPIEQPLGVPDRRGETDALDLAPRELVETRQHSEEMPASVIAGERVNLVDDHRLDAAKQPRNVDRRRHHHRLDRLRRGQKQVRRLAQDRFSLRSSDVAVPQAGSATESSQ